MTLVSVILPSLHVNSWLDTAVESVLADGYGEVEVLVLLDGWANPPDVAWAKDRRVRLMPLGERVGIARALNIGVSASRGEYLARMDGDDISLPGRFEAQVGMLRDDRRLAAVGTQALRIDMGGNLLEGQAIKVPAGARECRQGLLVRNRFVHPTMMFRKSHLERVNGYDIRVRTVEDYHLYLRLAREFELTNLDRPYLHYRVHPGQISRGFNPLTPDKLLVLRERRALARQMRANMLKQAALDGAWVGAQLLRRVRSDAMGLRSTIQG